MKIGTQDANSGGQKLDALSRLRFQTLYAAMRMAEATGNAIAVAHFDKAARIAYEQLEHNGRPSTS
jgi:energy-coupling factor transporter transmembrane protein EcfT